MPTVVAASTPLVAKSAVLIFRTDVDVDCVHVAPALSPLIVAAVTVPLLFTSPFAPDNVIVPLMVRFAEERMEWAAETVEAAESVPVPSIVVEAPVSRIGSVPASVPVPDSNRFPAIVRVPAAETVVVVTPLFTVTLPKVIVVVGVTFPLPVNIVVEFERLKPVPRVLVTAPPNEIDAAPLDVRSDPDPSFV